MGVFAELRDPFRELFEINATSCIYICDFTLSASVMENILMYSYINAI